VNLRPAPASNRLQRFQNAVISIQFKCRSPARWCQRPAKDGPATTRFSLNISRGSGFTMMLKDTNTDQAEGRAVEATLKIGETPFTAFRAEVQGKDEIAIFPQHGADSNGSPQRGTP
jgi:hypothetical protein